MLQMLQSQNCKARGNTEHIYIHNALVAAVDSLVVPCHCLGLFNVILVIVFTYICKSLGCMKSMSLKVAWYDTLSQCLCSTDRGSFY